MGPYWSLSKVTVCQFRNRFINFPLDFQMTTGFLIHLKSGLNFSFDIFKVFNPKLLCLSWPINFGEQIHYSEVKVKISISFYKIGLKSLKMNSTRQPLQNKVQQIMKLFLLLLRILSRTWKYSSRTVNTTIYPILLSNSLN